MKMVHKDVNTSPDLLHIEHLMRVASDALALAQALLSDRIERERAAPIRRKLTVQPVELPEDILANIQEIAAAFSDQLAHPDRKFSECWRDLVKARIHNRLYRAGRAGAAILLRMIEEPDIFLDQKDLALAAGVNSRSPNVIKVYICHLRNGLEDYGLSGDLIETGRRSYRLRTEAVAQIMEMVTRP